MTEFHFRSGARVTGVDAQTVGDELGRIYDEHGELTAPLVVDEARPDDAPLHPAFEWDDAVAAELHREHQARTLIRSVEIICNDDKEKSPSFVHVTSLASYVPAEIVARDLDMYDEAWRDAQERLAKAQHSLEQLERLCETRRPGQSSKVQRARKHLDRANAALTP